MLTCSICLTLSDRRAALFVAAVRCCPLLALSYEQLVLILSTGTAKGSVTVLSPCRHLRGSFSGRQRGNATTGSSAEDTRRCCQEAATATGGEVEASREVSLLITLMPAWSARFNRPVLPLGSLPARVVRSPGPRCPLHPTPPPPPAPPPGPVSTPTLGNKTNGAIFSAVVFV